MPQVIAKKRKEATEGLERSQRLAKQVLSQLSYTPHGISVDFRAFAAVQILTPRL